MGVRLTGNAVQLWPALTENVSTRAETTTHVPLRPYALQAITGLSVNAHQATQETHSDNALRVSIFL